MKVRILCGISDNERGHNLVYHLGEEYEVSEERALHFVTHGLAEIVLAPVVPKPVEEPTPPPVLKPLDAEAPEAAALDIPPEHAVEPRARKRG